MAALLKELLELHDSFELFAPEVPQYTLPQLRKGLDAQAAAVNHECSRFAIVMKTAARSQVDLASIQSLCGNIAESCAKFVSMVQCVNALTRSSGVLSGTLFRKDVQSKAQALIKAVIAMVEDCMRAVDKNGKLINLGSLAKMITTAGSTIELSESMLKVPQNPVGSVRRRLINIGKLIKVSVEEIREEHPKKDLTTLQGRELEVAKIIDGGVQVFRHVMDVMRDTLALVDLFKNAAVEPVSGSASVTESESSRTVTCEDLATCTEQLSDAVIDLAAALNDVELDIRDEEEVQRDKEEEENKPKKKYPPVEKDARGMVVMGGSTGFDSVVALDSDQLQALKEAASETQKALAACIQVAEQLMTKAPEGSTLPVLSACIAVAEGSIVAFQRML